MKFRKKHNEIEAERWFSEADNERLGVSNYSVWNLHSDICDYCSNTIKNHGWINTIDGGYIVCPGDWIITNEFEKYPCKPNNFDRMYEKVE